jgi:uncharacterized membrane protein
MRRHDYGGAWMDGGAWSVFIVCALLLLILAVVVAVLLIWRDRTTSPSAPAPRQQVPDALGLLEQRYAQGEIGEDEFRNRRRTLIESQTAVR